MARNKTDKPWMKWILCLFVLFSFSCAQIKRGIASKVEVRHLVFDIDWTIVTEVKEMTPALLKHKRIIEVQGKHYFINEGLEEFVEEALKHPELKVSFFSGGKSDRNLELLSKIKLKNGKSLNDIAYKILSSEDLVKVEGAPEGVPFAQRFKKDLTKVSKNLDELIMLDDTANFVLDGAENQNEKVFFIGTAFEYFDNFKAAEGKAGAYIPKSYDEWLLNRKKLYLLNEAFKEAYLEASVDGAPFSEAMKKHEGLLNLKDHQWNTHSRRYYQNVFKSPIKESSGDCEGLVKVLIGL